MDLFKLRAVIGLDTSEYERGVKNSSSLFDKAAGGIKKTAKTVGKTVAVGLGAGAAAFAALAKASLSARGELEQNMGGSQQVFKEFAKTIQDEGAQAYKNLGLSQSDYLATANKMGALLQGSGFAIEESMNMTTAAMQRAADVASIMGLDTSAAMEAVAGAAKGNFTMMDNLGVAINDTALAQYALSKGITKSTQEMSTQEKVGLAMELFLDKTAYAAGNYAKENATLAGSLSTAKAAFDNFLSGAGSAEQLVEAVLSAAQVVTSSLVTILPELAQGIGTLVAGLAPMLPELIMTLLPGLSSGVGTLIAGLIAALPSIFSALFSVLPEVGANLLAALITGITGNETSAQEVKTYISDLWNDIKTRAVEIWESIKTAIVTAWENIKTGVSTAINTVQSTMAGVWDTIKGAVATTWNTVKAVIETVWEAIKISVSSAINTVQSTMASVWNTIKGAAASVWNTIKTVIQTVWESIKASVSNAVNNVRMTVAGVFNSVKATVTTVWDNIKSTISSTWDTIKTNVNSAVSNIRTTVAGVFNGVKATVTTIWENIKSTISTKIEAAKTTVSNVIDAIKGFFDFTFEWPDIPTPHFSITPKGWKAGDLLKGSIPSIGIDWYANAMNNPMLLRGATIFGMQDGQFLGGGEAGPEIVAGANTVQRMIFNAVRAAIGSGAGGIVVNQNIYSEAKTAADLMLEARWEAERAVLEGV